MTTTQETRVPFWQRLSHVAATLVAIGAMLVVGIGYGVAGLIVTEWIVVMLAAVWFLLAVLGILLARRRSYGVLVIPLAAAAIWVGVILVASAFGGA